MRTEKLGEYIQKCRKAKKLTQEELCAGICDRTTLSRLERGKQTPGRDTLRALLHRLGLPEDLVPESEHDAKISALKKDIRADVIEFEKADQKTRPQLREQAMAKLKQMEKLTEKDDVINQQYILSTQVTLGKPDGPYTPAQRRKLLEKAIQMTVPGFRPDKAENFWYRLEETTLLNKLARTFSMEGKREEAIDLYSRLLQAIEKNGQELEGYPGQFCLIAYNYAINLGLAGRYEEALELVERGQATCVRHNQFLHLPGFLAIQAECQFFLGEWEKSADLYIRAGYLCKILKNIRDIEILRQEMRERLQMDPPF